MFRGLYPTLQVGVPVGKFPGITRISAVLDTAACFIAGQIDPCDATNGIGRQAKRLRLEKFAAHDFAGEGSDQHDLKTEIEVFAGNIEQACIFAVAQVLQIGRTVAVSRITCQQTHDVRAERTVSRVLVQKEKISSGTAGKQGQSLFGERGLACAGVASKENETGWVHKRHVFKMAV